MKAQFVLVIAFALVSATLSNPAVKKNSRPYYRANRTPPSATPTATPTATSVNTPENTPEATPVAEPATPVVAEPATAAVAEPAVAPVAEPAVASVAEPAVATVAEPAVATVAEPTVATVAEPAVAPVAEPAVAPVAEPATSVVAEPAVSPVAEPAVSPVAEPAVASVAVSEPTTTSVPEPVVTPVSTVVSPAAPADQSEGLVTAVVNTVTPIEDIEDVPEQVTAPTTAAPTTATPTPVVPAPEKTPAAKLKGFVRRVVNYIKDRDYDGIRALIDSQFHSLVQKKSTDLDHFSERKQTVINKTSNPNKVEADLKRLQDKIEEYKAALSAVYTDASTKFGKLAVKLVNRGLPRLSPSEVITRAQQIYNAVFDPVKKSDKILTAAKKEINQIFL